MNPDGTNILQLTFNTASDSTPAFSLNVKDGVRRNDIADGGEDTDTCQKERGDKKASCEQ
jgi:hypothetical protein